MPSSLENLSERPSRWAPMVMLRVTVLIAIIGALVDQAQTAAIVQPAFKVQSYALSHDPSQKSSLSLKAIKLDNDNNDDDNDNDNGGNQTINGGGGGGVDEDNDPRNQVSFENCSSDDYKVYGNVTSMSITPCQRSHPDDPCTFIHGSNYTIRLGFTTSLSAQQPRSSVVACDADGKYQYSGQSFNACKYAFCPITANKPSVYLYHFQTLGSPFDHLTFNVTQDFTGPSMFCAGTAVKFQQSA